MKIETVGGEVDTVWGEVRRPPENQGDVQHLVVEGVAVQNAAMVEELLAVIRSHDPWQLDYDGEGKRMADVESFLLPYYMGVYYGFIVER